MARLLLCLAFSACFTLATLLEPKFEAARGQASDASLLTVLMGDSRRVFANEFFAKADAYFHGGYYPSIFDKPLQEGHVHMTEAREAGQVAGDTNAPAESDDDERKADFLGPPQDWIERFGRNFFPATHEHLNEIGKEREILPWLKFAAEMDPHLIDTYTTAGYWLRADHRSDEAEQFLRQGLRANPHSYEILLDLGRIYYEDKHDPVRARNLWELASQEWDKQEPGKEKPNIFAKEQILIQLVKMERQEGNQAGLLKSLEQLKSVSLNADQIQKEINDLKAAR